MLAQEHSSTSSVDTRPKLAPAAMLRAIPRDGAVDALACNQVCVLFGVRREEAARVRIQAPSPS